MPYPAKIDFFKELNINDRVCYVKELDDFDGYLRGTIVEKEIDTFVIIRLDDGRIERIDAAYCIKHPHVKIGACMRHRRLR